MQVDQILAAHIHLLAGLQCRLYIYIHICEYKSHDKTGHFETNNCLVIFANLMFISLQTVNYEYHIDKIS